MSTPVPFTTHADADVEIHLTFKVGSISATLIELERVFGPARRLETVSPMHFEWRIAFADMDETVATIYDYKHPEAPAPDEVLSWCIGGRGRRAHELIHETFRHAIGVTQRNEEHFA